MAQKDQVRLCLVSSKSVQAFWRCSAGEGGLLEVSNLLQEAEAQTESSTRGAERLMCIEYSGQKALGKELFRHDLFPHCYISLL